MQQIWALDETHVNEWQRCVVAFAIGTRFQLVVDDLYTKDFDDKCVPKEHHGTVFKKLKEFLKNTNNKDLPPWFVSWKDKRAEEMRRKLGSADARGGGKAWWIADEATNQSTAEDEKDEEKKDEDKTNEDKNEDEKEDAVMEPTASDAAEFRFKVGDRVMCVATKAKDKWAQEGEITGLLSKHYWVKMLTGNAIGADHKFLIKDVKAIPSEKPAAKVAKTDAASDAGSMSMSAPPNPRDGESRDMLDIEDIEQIWVKKKLE